MFTINRKHKKKNANIISIKLKKKLKEENMNWIFTRPTRENKKEQLAEYTPKKIQ